MAGVFQGNAISLQDLIAQRDALNGQIEQAQQAKRAQAMQQATELLKVAGISRTEAAALLRKHIAAPKNPVPPKYRHAETGVTWTGRGRPPVWYRNAAPSDIQTLR